MIKENASPTTSLPENAVAIIGMSGRFPGAPDVRAFWDNLVRGVESLRRLEPGQIRQIAPELRDNPDYVPVRGVLDDADCFDAAFFGISRREAEAMDPQHRIFLECCWHALEDAGHIVDRRSLVTGIFAGQSLNTYLLSNLCRDRVFIDRITAAYQTGEFSVLFGNDPAFLATRVAHKLDLHGPAITVQTACSTSLVAVTQAVQSLLSFQSDLCLAGGVSVSFPQERGHLFLEGSMVSPDGHCRPFDAQAAGTVFGSGAGVVVLRRLEDAVTAGDRIYAVIRGVAVNNDGGAKASYSAPSVDGQREAIVSALALAGIEPDTIGYVEAHGTGTPLGDPIEFEALTRAFRESGATGQQYCALGSLKANIGHLEAAAGVASLIKTALAVRDGVLPPTLHFNAPNPHLDLGTSPFYLSAETRAWPDRGGPRRAGVSSFGVGGTNAHVVLEQAPPPPPGSIEPTPDAGERPSVFVLSARTCEAADDAASRLATHLEAHPEIDLADVAATLAHAREVFGSRLAVTARGRESLVRGLKDKSAANRCGAQALNVPPPVVFMFPGQGAQRAGMLRDLYRTEPVVREVVDECATIASPHTGRDVRELLLADPADPAAADVLRQTRFTQPCIFITELAMARLWQSWGAEPAALIGHSVGEYVAACLAGVMSVNDALAVVARRGALVQEQPAGAMLAVRLSESELAPLVPAGCSIAAINAPELCVVAGPDDAITALEVRLERDGRSGRRLVTSHAFHSPMMDPVVEPLEATVAGIFLHKPRLPIASTVTGKWMADAEATDPRYWARHAREAVRFAAALATVLERPGAVLLEVGPGRTLAQLARQHPAVTAAVDVVASQPLVGDQADGAHDIAEAAARLWTRGIAIDWRQRERSRPWRVVDLPGYPFTRARFWVEPPAPAGASAEATSSESAVVAAPVQDAAAMSEAEPRSIRLQNQVLELLESVSGNPTTSTSSQTNLLELGFDSLLLAQVATKVKERFGVAVTFRQLMERFTTPAALAAHLDATLPTDVRGKETAATPEPAARVEPAPAPARHGPFRPPERSAGDPLTDAQRRHLDTLVQAYCRRTSSSKRHASEHRTHFCDPRSVSGFNPLWKEMVYPIVCVRSRGSRLWDPDGNEYIDLTMGFGVNFFGHTPEFVSHAIAEQLERGFEIGPQSPLAGKAAQLLCELTGMERATFCNTGSEAVMAAMRVARTVTGRNRIVIFNGDYHGMFDSVLVRGVSRNGELQTLPIAPGIPHGLLEDVVVLEYGADESLAWIRQHARELAAVIAEPVQSRNPALQPREFLHALRAITNEAEVALVFDEVVTGFRCDLGGAQAYFGVRADMATYGKIIGGGMPIGALAGRRKWMDALDGGTWNYGDDSIPEVGVTFFAGTFVRHPLAMAAVWAALNHLKDQGPALQQAATTRTTRLATEINDLFRERGVAAKVDSFASTFHLEFSPDCKHAGLFFFHLRLRGVHFWEGRVGFLSTAHTDADIDRIVAVFRDAVGAMQSGGFLPRTDPANDRSCPSNNDARPHSVAESSEGRLVPLTEEQHEIWMACHISAAASANFNESGTIELRGRLDQPALEEAIRQLVARHEALRTVFLADGSAQRIKPHIDPPLTVVDIPQEPAARHEWLRAEAARPFDLEQGPLVRFLLSSREDGASLVFTAHHIACDGWSYDTLLHELAECYSARVRGAGSPSLAPAVQISTFAATAPVRAAAPEARAAHAFWRKELADMPAPLDLPADAPRPETPQYNGARATHTIPATISKALKGFVREQHTTLFTVLFSAYGSLLHRLTGARDFLIGVPVAGQHVQSVPTLVAHCVHFLPIRHRIDPAATFAQHIESIAPRLLDAFDHAHVSLGQLLREIKWQRDPSQPSPLGITFNLDPQRSDVRFEGLALRLLKNPTSHLNAELAMNVIDDPDGLIVECEYSTDLFTAASIHGWLRCFQNILETVVAAPKTPIERLLVLDADERTRVLQEWNPPVETRPEPGLLHRLFEARAAVLPDIAAIVQGATSVTYRDLDTRANRLARHLASRGTAPDQCVALVFERSVDFVVAVLATLKAGAAFVPIDPAWPAERQAAVLRSCDARLLVTRDHRAPGDIAVVDLAAEAETINAHAATPPEVDVRPEHLAYVIYTSGSTGAPKGVMIEHRAIAAHVQSIAKVYGISADDQCLMFHSVAFDPTVEQLFTAFHAGATVHVRNAELWTPREFADHVVRVGLSVVDIPPRYWMQLLQDWRASGGAPDLGRLRLVIVGGESLPPAAVRLWRELGMTDIRLINSYGPTECSVTATIYEVPTATNHLEASGRIPIGRPHGPVEAYILGPDLQPVPPKVKGELCIGGPTVGRGYLGHDDLTRERFVAHPFGRPGMIYRTGDLARFAPDGTIEFLGRIDRQVQVRGFRVELAEIESHLTQHAAVNNAAVVSRTDADGATVLAAFIEPAAGANISTEDLRRHLSTRLPHYMVPARFATVDNLPVDANGKVDRSILETLEAFEVKPARAHVKPRTAQEAALAAIWSRLLDRETIGVHDDFFELGGHSLLAMQMVKEIQSVFGVTIPLATVLSHPTVAAIAERIAGDATRGHTSTIARVDRSQPLPLSRQELRLWYLHHTLGRPDAYNVGSAQRILGPLDLARLESAFRHLVARHEILRTGYVDDNGTPRRRIVAEAAMPFTVDRPQKDVTPAEIEQLVAREMSGVFDLSRPPLLRVRCFEIDPEDRVLVVAMHHLICDEWSTQLLCDELCALYDRGASALPARAEALVEYADYAVWQQELLKSGTMQSHRDFWTRTLRGASPIIELPYDHPRPRSLSGAGAVRLLHLEPGLVETIESIGRQESATPFALWLSIFAALLRRQSGQSDLLVGTPLANRSQPELQSLVGYCLNTLPVRLRVEADTTFRNLVRTVRTAVLAAIEHGELPLDEIVACASFKRSPAGASLFSTLYTFVDATADAASFADTVSEPMRVETPTAKTDLSLFLQRSVDGSLCTALEFSTDLFEPATIERMLGQLECLVRGLGANPDAALSEVDLLPPAEREQVLRTSNDARADYPRDATVAPLFEETALRMPNETALICGETRVSYADLEASANRLAHHLIAAGVAPRSRVGIFIDRSVDFFVAVLAVFKAGAAYVPLATDLPSERLRLFVAETGVRVIVSRRNRPPADAAQGVSIVDLETSANAIAAHPPQAPSCATSADDVAYVMFTSGSTGQPKGVEIPHRGIVRLVKGQTYAPFGARPKVLVVASPAFDASTFEMWGPLLNGGTAVIHPDRLIELDRLEQTVRDGGVDTLFLTTGLFNRIVDQRHTVLETVAHVLTGGEAISPEHARRALAQLPGVRFSNIYGPTECTTFACVQPLDGHVLHSGGAIPIGRPIAHTRCYILDEKRRPVPIGIPGELYLGGDGLARGYLNSPELTAGKFVPDPFAGGGERLYRTGDRCRWLANGAIEFLGRSDDQVKVRGFRIEPAEIESALLQYSAVARAAVIARPDASGGRELVAFVVSRPGVSTTATELREFLERRLPAYMVPSRFATIDELPLNANGKVDRRTLAAREIRELSTDAENVAPRTPTETALAGIWRDMLGRDSVSVHDNFFDIGGHSILAMKLVHEIRTRLGVTVTLAILLGSPTIETLARAIDARRATTPTPPPQPDSPPPAKAQAPLATSAQPQPAPAPRRIEAKPALRGSGPGVPLFNIPGVFGYGLLPPTLIAHIHRDRPYYDGLQMPGADGQGKPLATVEQIAEEMIRQIREVRPHGPYAITGYCYGGLIAYEVANRLMAAGEVVQGLALWHSFPWQTWRIRSLKDRLKDLPGRVAAMPARDRMLYLKGQLLHPARALALKMGWRKAEPPPAELDTPIARANTKANELYRVRRPYHGRMYVIRASVIPDDMECPPLGGWEGFARGPIKIHDVDCEHLEMIRQPWLTEISRMTADWLRLIDHEPVRAPLGGMPSPALRPAFPRPLDAAAPTGGGPRRASEAGPRPIVMR